MFPKSRSTGRRLRKKMDLLAKLLLLLAVVTPAVWGQVEVPAFIVSHSDDVPVAVSPHTRVTLACAAFGIPIPNITWSSAQHDISTTDSFVNIYTTTFTDADGDVFILSLLELCDFDDSYAANYTCTASNEVDGDSIGTASVTVSLSAVTEPAILVAQSSSTADVFPGTRVSLICAAFGFPTPSVVWSKDTTPLTTGGNVNIYMEQFSIEDDQFILSILELCTSGSSDMGEYTCTAMNGVQNGSIMGSTSASFEIMVEYPALITSLRLIVVEPTPTSLELTCTPNTTTTAKYNVSVEWTQEFVNGSIALVKESVSFRLTPPGTHQTLGIMEYDFSNTLSFSCSFIDFTGNTVVSSATNTPLRLVTSELSVYMNGIQLANLTTIEYEDGTSEQFTLQCLATPGNYDPIWTIIPTPSSVPQPISDSFDFVVSYSSNEANLTIVDSGIHTGSTFRCQSQQSNVTAEVMIIASVLELDTSKHQTTILGVILGVTGGLLLTYCLIMVVCCVVPSCPLRKVFSSHPVPTGIDDGMSLRQLQSTVEGEEGPNQDGTGNERREEEKLDIHIDDELLLP